MFKKNLLLGKIVSAGYTREAFSKVIGVSKNTLTSRLNGHSPFKLPEIMTICKALEINDAEKIEIFLS